MAAEEVGVDVRLDHPLDRQPRLRRLLEVHADVATGIDDDRATGRLVTDEVRGVRQARQVVLSEDHRSPSQGSLEHLQQVTPPAEFSMQLKVRLISC